MDVEEYAREFLQEVLAESDAGRQPVEDVFFEKSCEQLMEAGELDAADRIFYRFPHGGIRVDGYGGDPADAEGTLSLIILDFHTTPETGRLTGSEMNSIFRRLLKYLRKTRDEQWRNALEETNPAFGLADLIAQRWYSISKIRLLLISNRTLSDRVDGHPADDIDEKSVTYGVWDIRRLYNQATAGDGQEDIEIDLDIDFGGPLPILPAHQSGAGYESYLAILPGETLANIYDRWETRLLEQNVRVFLQARGQVNRGIRRTLENEPSMFFAYNNGITATAEEIHTKNETGQLLLCRLKNFQIVNGGQTTASIHAAKRRKHDLSKISVQMKLSVVTEDRATELVPRISEYANSQNKVTKADFFSNHPFHIRIEEFSRRMFAPPPDGTFRQNKWFYERARGQYADARARLTTAAERTTFDLVNPKSQLFSKTDLAKFINVWEFRPHVVSLGAQKNFAVFAQHIDQAWDKSSDGFGEAWYRSAIAKAIIFKAAERIVSGLEWYQGGYRANIVAYTIAKIAHDVNSQKQGVNFESIWRRQSPGEALVTAIATVAKPIHDTLINPPAEIRNVTEWAKKDACWQRIQNLEIAWLEAFDEDLVSVEEQRDSARAERRNQQELNRIQAEIAVVRAGGQFWSNALAWGEERNLLVEREIGILRVASDMPNRMPSDRQSSKAVEILNKLREAGYPERLPTEP